MGVSQNKIINRKKDGEYMKRTDEEHAKALEHYHNLGEQSAARGEDHSDPNSELSMIAQAVFGQDTQELRDENEAFEKGWDNAHKQR